MNEWILDAVASVDELYGGITRQSELHRNVPLLEDGHTDLKVGDGLVVGLVDRHGRVGRLRCGCVARGGRVAHPSTASVVVVVMMFNSGRW